MENYLTLWGGKTVTIPKKDGYLLVCTEQVYENVHFYLHFSLFVTFKS